MANDISGNPWKLDTAGVVTKSGVKMKNIVWANGAADGDVLLIQDNTGRDIVRAKYATQGDNMFGAMDWVNGVNLVTIASGTVLVNVHK